MPDEFSRLRKLAEEKVKKEDIDISALSEDKIQSIIHNLEVHQVELEMQNAQLQVTQKSLEESKQKYFELFEFSPVGFVILDHQLKIINTNHAFSKLIQYEKEDLIAQPLTSFINPEHQDIFYLAYRTLMKGNSKKAIDIKMNTSNGNMLWAHVEILTRDEAKTFIVSVTDITDRKKQEIQVKRSEERLRLALEGTTDGVWDWNLENNEIFYSPNWKKMLGYQVNEVENKFSLWEKLTHPDDMNKAWENLNQYLEGKTTQFNQQFRMKHKNGHWVSILSRAVVTHFDEHGKPKRIIGTHVDISELKQTQQQLREALALSENQQKEIKELLTATQSILKTTDFESAAKEIFLSAKRSIGAKAGYVALLSENGKDNDLLFLDDGGLPCSVDPNLPMPVRGLREQAYKTGKVAYDNDFMNSEWAKFMPEGHVALPNVLFAPLNIQGETVGVLGLSNKETDFTKNDVKMATAFGEYAAIALQNSRILKSLEKRAKELQELNATKDRIFSIIGHDLINPINNILGFSRLINDKFDKYPSQKKKEFNLLIHNSASVVAQILDNLLTWSRSQRNNIDYQPELRDLNEVVKNTLHLMDPVARNKSISIKNKLKQPQAAYCDFNLTGTVLRNIISNAIKFTPQNGEIQIWGQEEKGHLTVTIKDNGIGMGEGQLEALFEVNNKPSKGTDGEKGTGLGLIICKEFVELYNGKIWVESKPDEGTEVKFTLPLA